MHRDVYLDLGLGSPFLYFRKFTSLICLAKESECFLACAAALQLHAQRKGGFKGGICFAHSLAVRGASPAYTICIHSQNQTEQNERKRGGKDEAGGESGAKMHKKSAFLASEAQRNARLPTPHLQGPTPLLSGRFRFLLPFQNLRKRTNMPHHSRKELGKRGILWHTKEHERRPNDNK